MTRFYQLAVAGALVFMASSAMAQSHTKPAQPQMQPQAQQQTQLSQQQIEQFREAYGDVAAITQRWQQKIADKGEEQNMAKVQKQMNSELTEAINDAGLTVDDYNLIAMSIQRNPQLMRKVFQN